jgi:hypothetical protein
MDRKSLLRISAVAAIAGGLLRAADPLFAALHLDNAALQQIWFAIDLLLLIGAAGIYLAEANRLGVIGLAGALVFLFGILLVRSAGVTVLGIGGYQSGAAIALLGIALLALAMLLRRTQIAASLLWLAALLSGLASRSGFGAAYLVALSGVLFGLGFAAAGVGLLRLAYKGTQSAQTAISTVT